MASRIPLHQCVAECARADPLLLSARISNLRSNPTVCSLEHLSCENLLGNQEANNLGKHYK